MAEKTLEEVMGEGDAEGTPEETIPAAAAAALKILFPDVPAAKAAMAFTALLETLDCCR